MDKASLTPSTVFDDGSGPRSPGLRFTDGGRRGGGSTSRKVGRLRAGVHWAAASAAFVDVLTCARRRQRPGALCGRLVSGPRAACRRTTSRSGTARAGLHSVVAPGSVCVQRRHHIDLAMRDDGGWPALGRRRGIHGRGGGSHANHPPEAGWLSWSALGGGVSGSSSSVDVLTSRPQHGWGPGRALCQSGRRFCSTPSERWC